MATRLNQGKPARAAASGGGRARLPLLAARHNAILERIATGAPLEEILNALLRLMEEDAPEVIASIVVLDPTGKRVARCYGPTLPEAYSRALEGVTIGPNVGSCGTAAWHGKTVIVEDIATDPLWADYKELALAHNLRACWSAPIFDSERRVLGTFAMYLDRPGKPNARHFKLIEAAAHMAAIAIARAQREEERDRLALDLRERVKELSLFHAVARRLERSPPLTQALLEELVAMLPSAWLHEGICEARIAYGDLEATTRGWRETPWRLTETFRTQDGTPGVIEVVYLEERPAQDEGPFLAEERNLLQSLTVSFTTYLERTRAEAALYESAERYRLVNLATDDAVWDWDLRTGTLWWNDAVTKRFGWPKNEIRNDIQWWADRVHPDDRDRVHDSLHAASEGDGHVWAEEYRFQRRDGTYADIHDRGYLLRDPEGRTIRMIGVMQDITERKRAEIRIRRLNRTYEVLSNINSVIVRIRDREQLFREACRVAVEHGQFGIAWVGRVEGCGTVAPLVWGGGKLDPALLGNLGHCAIDAIRRAIAERRPAYCNNLAAQAQTAPAVEDILRLGFPSLVCLPLQVGGTLIGLLVLHTREPDFFDQDEMKLLEELSADISFALEYIEKEEKINELAFHEPLTRLPNRTSLQTWLEAAVDEAAARKQALALLLLNLDNFRDINDTLGHANGDQLLCHVANSLKQALWTSDRVAALGGDEFAILLPRLAAKSDIDLVLRKISTALGEPVSIGGIPVNIEASIGIAVFPDHGETADALWQHADVALRTAKERRVPEVFYSPAIDHYDPERLALAGELRDAIPAGQLVMHYQPVIHLESGRVAGIEALVRWQHPQRGLLFPDRFIPLAERTALINPLTSAVVEKALHEIGALARDGIELHIAVNLSVRNLHDPAFAAQLLAQARAAGFPLERLILEVTESAIMTDHGRARETLQQLHDAGIRLSMDDFGIGHSSLAYLKDLPISRMKIDKSFVMHFTEARNAAIVRSAIELGHNLGLSVTAEGVEDEATAEALREMGCDTAQGYYFSRALPMEELREWLRRSPWGCPAGDPGD